MKKKKRIPWNKGMKGVFKHTEESKKRISSIKLGNKRRFGTGTKKRLIKCENCGKKFHVYPSRIE